MVQQATLVILAAVILVATVAIVIIILSAVHSPILAQSPANAVGQATLPDAIADLPGCSAYCDSACRIVC